MTPAQLGVVAVVAFASAAGGAVLATELRDDVGPEAAAAPSAPAPTAAGSLAATVARVAPSVVGVSAHAAGRTLQGSGFFTADGYVVTSAHVVTNSAAAESPAGVRRPDWIFIRFDDRDSAAAELVGYDLQTDVALLKPGLAGAPPPPLVFADGVPPVGTQIAVVGFPFGRGHGLALTTGVISATERPITTSLLSFAPQRAIEIDAEVNPGNSGGPLVDDAGRVLGVVAQRRFANGTTPDSLAFAVPASTVADSVAQLRASGRAVHPWLGVTTRPLTPALARAVGVSVTRGLLVQDVTTGSPAAAIGLSSGTREVVWEGDDRVRADADIVLALDDREIGTLAELEAALEGRTPGDTVRVTVLRRGRKEVAELVLGSRPDLIAG